MTDLTDADRQQIIDVVRRADELATAHDVQGYLALTTPDMELDGAQGTASGHADLGAAIAKIWAAEPAGTRHITGDIAITPGEDATAIAHSTMTLVNSNSEVAVSITQLLRKTDGAWLIARRTVGGPLGGR